MPAAKSILVLAISLGALSVSRADAVETSNLFSANASNMCQPSLPVFESAIRKRPLAVQNEGDANAYVTCSFSSNAVGRLHQVWLQLFNMTDVPKQVSCTGVTGSIGDANQYVVKTDFLAPQEIKFRDWKAGDFTGTPQPPNLPAFPSPFFSVLCHLPPGTGISETVVNFEKEDAT